MLGEQLHPISCLGSNSERKISNSFGASIAIRQVVSVCPGSHLITDDPRSKNELKDLLTKACELQGLVEGKDFRVDYLVLYDPDGFLDYFTKRHRKDVILFQKGLRLQKFYQIGKWFRKKKSKIWKDFIRKTYGTC